DPVPGRARGRASPASGFFLAINQQRYNRHRRATKEETLMKPFFRYSTLSLLILFAASALAQAPSTGAQLSGTILDPNGAVIRGAAVTLHSETTGTDLSTVSD